MADLSRLRDAVPGELLADALVDPMTRCPACSRIVRPGAAHMRLETDVTCDGTLTLFTYMTNHLSDEQRVALDSWAGESVDAVDLEEPRAVPVDGEVAGPPAGDAGSSPAGVPYDPDRMDGALPELAPVVTSAAWRGCGCGDLRSPDQWCEKCDQCIDCCAGKSPECWSDVPPESPVAPGITAVMGAIAPPEPVIVVLAPEEK